MEKQVSAHWGESWVCWPPSRTPHHVIHCHSKFLRSKYRLSWTRCKVTMNRKVVNLDMGNPLRAVKEHGMVLALALLVWSGVKGSSISPFGETRPEQRYYGTRHSARLVLNGLTTDGVRAGHRNCPKNLDFQNLLTWPHEEHFLMVPLDSDSNIFGGNRKYSFSKKTQSLKSQRVNYNKFKFPQTFFKILIDFKKEIYA
jgi:hypothetical protein